MRCARTTFEWGKESRLLHQDVDALQKQVAHGSQTDTFSPKSEREREREEDVGRKDE